MIALLSAWGIYLERIGTDDQEGQLEDVARVWQTERQRQSWRVGGEREKEGSQSRVGEYYIQVAIDRWRWGQSQDERNAGVGREMGKVVGEKKKRERPGD